MDTCRLVWFLKITAENGLVGYNTRNTLGERLLNDQMLNVVLVLMVGTSILGPLLTERFAPSMLQEMPNASSQKL